MLIQEVDERGSSWEGHGARFRVYFFSGGGEGSRSWSVETLDVQQADVLEVVEWAAERAGIASLFAVALLVPARSAHDGSVAVPGLVWLLGTDANAAPLDEPTARALDGMYRRRDASRRRTDV